MLKLAIIALAALGLALLFLALRAFQRERFVKSGLYVLGAGFYLAAALAAGFLGTSLLTYQRLTQEQVALTLEFVAIGDRHYEVTMRDPQGAATVVKLRGDEWQLDGRILKWRGLATVLGFDTVYRLERISGRYRDIADEKGGTRTVHALHERDRVDSWDFARFAGEWLPFIDARYGNAVFLPMADGAAYQATVSATGLLARPLNEKAKLAVGGWR